MAKMWTVRAKRQMNSSIPEGFTISVTTQQNVKNWPDLEKALRAAGVDVPWGCMNDGWWDWM